MHPFDHTAGWGTLTGVVGRLTSLHALCLVHWQDGEDWMEEPMVLVLLLAEAFVSMVYNVKQVGRARGLGAECEVVCHL